MSIRKIMHAFELDEARGRIPAGMAMAATYATVVEAGCSAFHKSYFGDKAWMEARTSHQAEHQAGEEVGNLRESLITDISRMSRVLRETMTTSDFPFVLAQIRNRVIRDSFNPVASEMWGMGEKRTATDFRVMKGYRIGTFNRLPVRPEGTDVFKTTIGQTEDGYQVNNYELGFDFTWEMWKNDDLSVFTIALKNLGIAANRTRGLVALQAIYDGIARTTPAINGVGGPTIDRLSEVVTLMASQTQTDGDGNVTTLPFTVTDIAYPASQLITANTTLKSATVIGPTNARTPNGNPVFGIATPHMDPAMAEVLGQDWLAWDKNTPFLECAVLDDFLAGPLTYTKLPTEKEHPDQGSFDNHSMSVKVGDAIAAKVTQTKSVFRIAGN